MVAYDLETSEIYVIGEDGVQIPAPVGEHQLESGEIVIVTEAGKIAEVKKGEEPKLEIEIEAAEVPAEEKKRLLTRYMEDGATDFAGEVRDNAYNQLIPNLQILHRQFMTSAPNARENFMTEAKTILSQFKGSMSMSDLNFIRTNLPYFARLI
jgi:hypothetical protein